LRQLVEKDLLIEVHPVKLREIGDKGIASPACAPTSRTSASAHR
jgi:hypothetical protein